MNKIGLGLGILVSSSAFAAKTTAPAGTGNFRRAEAIAVAGGNVKTGTTSVAGLSTIGKHVAGGESRVRSRVLVVQTAGKVTLVKAPLDKTVAVTKMTVTEAKRVGIVTQAAARQRASFNKGELGQKGRVKLTDLGFSFSGGGSYLFRQTAPATKTVKQGDRTYIARNIVHTVSITGKGETAHAVMAPVTK